MTTRTLQILLALTGGPLHGYGIRQAVADRTHGAVVLGSGTLYEAIDRLTGKGWLTEVEPPEAGAASGGPPRRYYALTGSGRDALRAELERMRSVVQFARESGLFGDA